MILLDKLYEQLLKRVSCSPQGLRDKLKYKTKTHKTTSVISRVTTRATIYCCVALIACTASLIKAGP
jgi:hypothetical protein